MTADVDPATTLAQQRRYLAGGGQCSGVVLRLPTGDVGTRLVIPADRVLSEDDLADVAAFIGEIRATVRLNSPGRASRRRP